jgi:hypothetical protein
MTTTRDIEDLLKTLLAEAGEFRFDVCALDSDPSIDAFVESRLHECRAETFEERGLLTSDAGIVLSLADGSEFQITIVRSR